MKFSKFLTLISVFLLLIATSLLASQRYVWDAFFLLAWATLALSLVLWRTVVPPSRYKVSLRHVFPRTWMTWVRILTFALSLWVAFTARSKPSTEDFTLLLILWLCTCLGFALTLVLPWLKTKPRLHYSRTEIQALIVLLLIAFLIRGVALSHIPANLGGDEGTQALAGLKLLDYPLGNPFATGWYSVPTMSFFIYGAAMRVFGTSIGGVRLLSALVGTVTVLSTFVLGYEMGGRKVAWVAALVMTFSAYHIHFSRLASNQIMDPLIGTLAIWLVWRALHLRPLEDAAQSELCWGAAGLVTGFGWYVYFGARWMTLLIGLILGWRFLFDRRLFQTQQRGLRLFILAWLLVALPLFGWYSRYPSPLTERYNAVNIFASGWVAREMAATGKSVAQLLLQQTWKSITAFHLTPDPTFWYFPNRPLLDFVTGALMIVGIIAAIMQWRQLTHSTTLLWFGATLVMAWTLTENPPSSQRGLLLMPAVALLVAWGVLALERVFQNWHAFFYRGLAVLLTATVILNLVFYFGIYTPRRSYGNPTAETATELAHFVLANPFPACTTPSACFPHPIYFLGAPELYWDSGTLAFLLRDQHGVDVLPEQEWPVITLPARFIFMPARNGDMMQVQAQYPDGNLRELTSSTGRPLAFVYDVP